MRAGSLKPAGVYSPRFHAARSHRSARGLPASLSARSAGQLGSARARLGAAQAPRRVPPHHAALHRHGRLHAPRHARDVTPERVARSRALAARMVAGDPPLARDADAPHGDGAAGARRSGHRLGPAREQPLQRGAGAARGSGRGARTRRHPEGARRAGGGDGGGGGHRQPGARLEDRRGHPAARQPRGSALPVDRCAGVADGAAGKRAHGGAARGTTRRARALARRPGCLRRLLGAARPRRRLRYFLDADPAALGGAPPVARALERALRRHGQGGQPRRARRARRAAQRHVARARAPRCRAALGGAGARGAQHEAAAGERGQIGISGEHESRAAHAVERDPRLHRDAERRALRPGARRISRAARRHPDQRTAPLAPDQRCPRSVEDRGGPHGALAWRVLGRGGGQYGACVAPLARRGKGPRVQGRGR